LVSCALNAKDESVANQPAYRKKAMPKIEPHNVPATVHHNFVCSAAFSFVVIVEVAIVAELAVVVVSNCVFMIVAIVVAGVLICVIARLEIRVASSRAKLQAILCTSLGKAVHQLVLKSPRPGDTYLLLWMSLRKDSGTAVARTEAAEMYCGSLVTVAAHDENAGLSSRIIEFVGISKP
jgi:hypothetical protein